MPVEYWSFRCAVMVKLRSSEVLGVVEDFFLLLNKKERVIFKEKRSEFPRAHYFLLEISFSLTRNSWKFAQSSDRRKELTLEECLCCRLAA